MENTPIWKPVVVVAVLALCGLSLYPPRERLKPGLDLAGGTTLVYQVDVPQGQDANSVLDQTIASLRKRVDPNGVRNLVWRRQAGNRIEIQMPLAPPQAVERRTEYLRLRQQLYDANIDVHELRSVVRAGGAHREAMLKHLAGGRVGLNGALTEMASAYDRMEAARGPYREAQEAVHKARTELEHPPAEGAADRTELADRLKQLEADLVAKTRPFVDARKAYDAAEQLVMAFNVEPRDLELVLTLPGGTGKAGGKEAGQADNPRARGLRQLIEKHRDRAEQIQAVADAQAAYAQVRGPLDDPNDLIALLRGSGVLEFRIAAAAGQVPDEAEYRDQLRQRGPRAGLGKSYRWYVIDDVTSFAESANQRRDLERAPEAYFTARGMVGQKYAGDYYLLLANTPEKSMEHGRDGWKLTGSYPVMDEGFPVVGFELNRVGGELMGALTKANISRPMAIVLDGRVISAPNIRSAIQDRGIITGGRGGFSQAEQDYLIRTLNAGSLQGRLSQDPVYIKKFGPQLGQDNLHRGLESAGWSLVAVAALMAVYYLFLGFVADFALLANMVVILGVMAVFDATFTLPGIAGIVLTIGMAVDANVLIFERITEELARKVDVRTAIRLGYEKAFATILDANITTLITCVVLFYTATAEIKGFALTLMIGILASMFTAVFCTRVVVDVYVDLTGAKTLRTLPTLIRSLHKLLNPNLDWVKLSRVLMTASAATMVASVAVLYTRGGDLLDIEFRSGTQVSFELAHGKRMGLAEVRSRLDRAAAESGLAQLAGNRATVVTVGAAVGTEASEFSVATLETDAAAVSHAIKAAFADVLDTQQPIGFAGMGEGTEAPPIGAAPVYPIRNAALGENINRPQVDADVSEFIGGVAVVLDDLKPAATTDEIANRIQRMRMQPSYESLGYRTCRVIGLDVSPEPAGEEGPRYRSAVVVTADRIANYVENPDSFSEPLGLAVTEWALVRDAMLRDTSLGSVSNFSSQVSNTMKQQAAVALTLSLLAVVVYIWIRFGSLRYGIAAIAALVHDVTIAMGLVAVSGWVADTAFGRAMMLSDFKINLALVAAMLTLVGYSLNDTIVVFDRVRENRGRLDFASPAVVNDSINQTISRTIMTSLTTLLAIFLLYVLGGPGVHGFAFAMLVGVVVGTYSSIAIASPLLLILGKWARARAETAPAEAGVARAR